MAGTSYADFTFDVSGGIITVNDLVATLSSTTATEGTPIQVIAVTDEGADVSASVTYTWMIFDGTNWVSALGADTTSPSYTPVEGDEGKSLRLVTTYAADPPAGESAIIDFGVVNDQAPSLTVTVTGAAQEGQTLTAHPVSNEPSETTFTYQWQWLNGSTWTNLSAATSATYVVRGGDEGHQLRVEVVSHVTDGSGTIADSLATAAVIDQAPSLTVTVTGAAQEGQTLTAHPVSSEPSETTFTYQWQWLNGSTWTNLSAATSATYVVQGGDEGHQLRVEVVSHVTDGSGTIADSLATAAVIDQAPNLTVTVTGAAQDGQTLTAHPVSNEPSETNFSYQWQWLNGSTWTNLSAATSATYVVQESDEGHQLRVEVTSHDSDGSGLTIDSSATTVAADETATMSFVENDDNKTTIRINFSEAVTTLSAADFSFTYQTGAATHTSTPSGSVSHSLDGKTWTIVFDAFTGSSNHAGILTLNGALYTFAEGSQGVTASLGSLTSPGQLTMYPAGAAGSPINLGLGPTFGSESNIDALITGIPTDWSLNQGGRLPDGSWTVQSADLTSLAATAPTNFAGALTLEINLMTVQPDGTISTVSLTSNVEAFQPGSPIFAISGDDTLTGSSGADLFVFAQPIGNDTIYNFAVAADQIDLVGFGNFTSFANVQARTADDTNGNAVITLSDGETITLVGVHAASLSASNFVFDQEPSMENAGTITIGDGAILPLGGVINNTGTITLNSAGNQANLEILVHGATLQGGGHVTLSANNGNVIFGGATDAILTNVDNIVSGAGQIGAGQLTIVNEAAGVIDGNAVGYSLVLDTSDNAIMNNGTIEASNGGEVEIRSNIINAGLLFVSAGSAMLVDNSVANSGIIETSGTLDVLGLVSGDGVVKIDSGGTLEFGSASSSTVTFANDSATTGILVLDDSQEFTGQIVGFAGDGTAANSNLIDLKDIDFSHLTQEIYTENSSGGTLTLSDGTHAANIDFIGKFVIENFTLSNDGSGGVLIIDSPVQSASSGGAADTSGTVTAATDTTTTSTDTGTPAATDTSATSTDSGSTVTAAADTPTTPTDTGAPAPTDTGATPTDTGSTVTAAADTPTTPTDTGTATPTDTGTLAPTDSGTTTTDTGSTVTAAADTTTTPTDTGTATPTDTGTLAPTDSGTTTTDTGSTVTTAADTTTTPTVTGTTTPTDTGTLAPTDSGTTTTDTGSTVTAAADTTTTPTDTGTATPTDTGTLAPTDSGTTTTDTGSTVTTAADTTTTPTVTGTTTPTDSGTLAPTDSGTTTTDTGSTVTTAADTTTTPTDTGTATPTDTGTLAPTDSGTTTTDTGSTVTTAADTTTTTTDTGTPATTDTSTTSTDSGSTVTAVADTATTTTDTGTTTPTDTGTPAPTDSGLTVLTIESGAMVEIGVASAQDVSFINNSGTTGELVLTDSKDFTGHILGFAGDGTTANSDLIDIGDVDFANVALEKTAYIDNGDGTGTLTLYDADGHILSSIDFVGNYELANFTIESDGNSGTLIIDPPVQSTEHDGLSGGSPNSGALTIESGSTAEIDSASAQTIYFANNGGTAGTLVLDDLKDFTGQVVGFAGDGTAANSDSIDLKDIDFNHLTHEAYTENNAGTGGTLTLSDGMHTANINFVGNYELENFKLSNDGSNGTLIVDPPVELAVNNNSLPIPQDFKELLSGSSGAQSFSFNFEALHGPSSDLPNIPGNIDHIELNSAGNSEVDQLHSLLHTAADVVLNDIFSHIDGIHTASVNLGQHDLH